MALLTVKKEMTLQLWGHVQPGTGKSRLLWVLSPPRSGDVIEKVFTKTSFVMLHCVRHVHSRSSGAADRALRFDCIIEAKAPARPSRLLTPLPACALQCHLHEIFIILPRTAQTAHTHMHNPAKECEPSHAENNACHSKWPSRGRCSFDAVHCTTGHQFIGR